MADYATLTGKVTLLGTVQNRIRNVQRVLTNAQGAEADMINSDKAYSTQQMTVQNMLSGARNLIELAVGDLETLMQRLLYVPVVKVDTDKGLTGFQFDDDATTSFDAGGSAHTGKSWIRAIGVTGEKRNPLAVFAVGDVITISNSEDSANDIDVTISAIILAEDAADLTDGGLATAADNVMITSTNDLTDSTASPDTSAILTLSSR